MKTIRYIENRIFWFFAKPIRIIYRYVFRPQGTAVRVLINRAGKFLLVRPTYGHRLWSVPGGAVDRGEALDEAGRREVAEETGLIVDDLVPLGSYISISNYLTSTVHVFYAKTVGGTVEVDGIEIKEAGWFLSDTLPTDRTERADQIINLYRNRKVESDS